MMWRTRAALDATSEKTIYDVIVSGGGMVGAAMVTALQQLRQRLRPRDEALQGLSRIMMMDIGKRPVYEHTNIMHQLRTVSITPVSSKILDNLGSWSMLTTKHPLYRVSIRHEQVNGPSLNQEERSQFFLMRAFLGKKPTTKPLLDFTDLRRPIGFVCFNTELHQTLVTRAEELMIQGETGLQCEDKLLFESKLMNIRLPPKNIESGPLGCASLMGKENKESMEEVKFGLLLGCEGRGSALRDLLSTPSLQHDYSQTAFVCTVRIEKVADGNVCSFQNFFRDGKIIAFLPTSQESANIVFTTTPEHAEQLQSSTQDELVLELNRRLHDYAPHDIPKILEVPEGSFNGVQRRAQGSFPLKLNFVTTPYASRAILLGDAAHGIHPFAGQGLNLGIYDVCALTHILEKALKAGQDIGSIIAVGQRFAGEMAVHAGPIIAGMEAIKSFTYQTPALSCLGMKLLDKIPLLSTFGKDAVVQVASGATFAARHNGCFLLE